MAKNISIHAPRTGSDMIAFLTLYPYHHFNPRSPHGERPLRRPHVHASHPFQSTLPARGATETINCYCMIMPFQSTLPARGATKPSATIPDDVDNFNPRSPHGERLLQLFDAFRNLRISIHAPRTGSDARYVWRSCAGRSISIHAPRTGSDVGKLLLERVALHFNPRSPHGERRHGLPKRRIGRRNFNPRSPHGERHYIIHTLKTKYDISIHAPRTGSDSAWTVAYRAVTHFNPRSPHGERRAFINKE